MNDSDNSENISCLRCGKAMTEAQLLTYLNCQPVVRRERKGMLSAPVQTGTECYVCTECGYIELRAKEPQKLIFRTEK